VCSREINDQILTLSASGWTYFDTFILYDYETESMWFPVVCGAGFTCITGVFEDLTLPLFPSELTGWTEWKNEHPDSKYLPDQN